MSKITRRQFLLGAGAFTACGLGLAAGLSGNRWWERAPQGAGELPPIELPTPWSVEARYYVSFASEGSLNCALCHGASEAPLHVSYCHIPHTGNFVKCNLCPHGCILADGQRGRCRTRENRGGRLYSMAYGNPCAVHVDPIEKKPFYHFLPTAAAFSIATAGCNLRCLYCFPPATPVLTDQGVYTLEYLFEQGKQNVVRPDGEISYPQGIRVLGADGQYHPLRAAFRHPYTGPLMVIKPYYLPELCCTPDHRLLATTDPGSGRVETVEACHITRRHFLVIPKAVLNDDHCPDPGSLDVAAILEGYQGTYSTPHYSLSPEQVDFIHSLADDANYFYIPVRSVDERPFSGHVYNLEVEEEHSYLAGLVAVKNCQNWQISQFPPEETQNVDLPPEAVVQSARQYDAPVIAYTYSEPTAFYEYMLETARTAQEAGLYNTVISAGFINPDPLRELCAAVDAIKIDLKGYDEGFYREVCSAHLQPVLDAIRVIYEAGVHLEIVNLVVPTLNDNLDQLRALARWVAQDVSPDVPLHFSRFHPQYKLTNLPPTPVETLDKAREIALEEGVRFVYVGNIPGHPGNNTYCPACGEAIIVREGFAVREYHLDGGKCAYCGEPIPGVWWP